MNTDYDRFSAFYQTSTFWQGSLGGLQQFPLSNFDFSHLDEQQNLLELPNIPHGTVLGKRAEYFFEFCARQSSNYEVLASNIQIFRGNRTLGEIDYILKHRKTNQILHVELVYKFYIYEPGKTHASTYLSSDQNKELSNYVGPNRRDNFIKKFDHLKNKQLPILQIPETIELLESIGIDTNSVKQQVCFLAHVYIPREMWQHDFKYLNKRCIKGYYMDEFAFAKAETSNSYFLPEKKQWKMKPQPLQETLTYHEIVPMVSQSLHRGFAPLIWMELADGSFETFFVVAALPTN
ncbi:hypothetical protein SAMN05192588_0766 [Nonlabens sp. Hel1_33_55]|uniref:DUF1853 family protein n=1 Tax=Nonlabens sp. Hel1_33_55 TaxID=1336802 RepID=UPI000875D249|nr:DUF1853 family protein [Nonlabens sp. Hel1_33_55]SCY02079.1 hypothetical protein SAMN05192588_0766 [Nonlabens sp. Hel1_33_55]